MIVRIRRARRLDAAIGHGVTVRLSDGRSSCGLHLSLGVVVHKSGVAGEVLRRRSRDGDGDGVGILSGRHGE